MIEYCDKDNEVVINYLSNFPGNLHGLQKIENIFLNVKNSIIYDVGVELQRASETLVMGYGNNIDKSILLYSLISGAGFKASLLKCDVKSESELFGKNNNIFPWFYVEVDILDRKIELDCSFDKFYMRAWDITNKSYGGSYSIEDFYIKDKKLFNIINRKIITEELLYEDDDIYKLALVNNL